MRSLNLPQDRAGVQRAIVERMAAREREGLFAHVRALLTRGEDGAWAPVCGRIDVAREEDVPRVPARPVGSARLLMETVPIALAVERLESAFRGEAFTVQGIPIVGHGMNSAWLAAHHLDDWKDYGTGWPCVQFASQDQVKGVYFLPDVIEAEGTLQAFDGLHECARRVMGYPDARDAMDGRLRRFAIIEWDYRGIARVAVKDAQLRVMVKPPKDNRLRLSLVVRRGARVTRRTITAPRSLAFKLPIAGGVDRVNVTLRHGDDIVCVRHWNAAMDRWLRPGERSLMAPMTAEALPSTAVALMLGFMADPKLATMVARDFEELDRAIAASAAKAAVLLSGSILESMLLDVLKRNESQPLLHLKNRWPDRASLKELIDTASKITIANDDGTTTPLLPPLTGKKGTIVTDHRDLIHPRAEVRGGAPIDMDTVATMKGLLNEVVRDLRRAHEAGVLDAFQAGKVV